MKLKIHRLNAHTMMETMVALILTAIAISVIYAAIRFMDHQQTQLNSKIENQAMHTLLYNALKSDTRKAEKISLYDGTISFHYGTGFVDYIISDSFCVRNDATTLDTFYVKTDSIACWFLSKRVSGSAKSEPVEEVVLYMETGGTTHPICIRKHYDTATLMRLTTPYDE